MTCSLTSFCNRVLIRSKIFISLTHCLLLQNVAKLKSEHSQWLTSEATGAKNFINLEGSNKKETIALVNKAEENERTRRMSIPFSAAENETDLDLSLASTQLSNVHQELLHLFAIHDVSSF